MQRLRSCLKRRVQCLPLAMLARASCTYCFLHVGGGLQDVAVQFMTNCVAALLAPFFLPVVFPLRPLFSPFLLPCVFSQLSNVFPM